MPTIDKRYVPAVIIEHGLSKTKKGKTQIFIKSRPMKVRSSVPILTKAAVEHTVTPNFALVGFQGTSF